jgi:hypothetical protein
VELVPEGSMKARDRIALQAHAKDCADVALGLRERASDQHGELAQVVADLAAVVVGLASAIEGLAMDK